MIEKFLYKPDGTSSKLAWAILITGLVYVVTWFVGLFGGLLYGYLIDPHLYGFAAVPFTGGVVARAWQMRAEAGYSGILSRQRVEVPEIGSKTPKKQVVKTVSKTPETANFTMDEFHCKDGTKVPEKLYANLQRLMINLQVIRDEMNHRYAKKRGGEIKLHISSGYRTESHNKKVGGSKTSRHMYADAGDIFPELATPKELYDCIEDLIKQGEVTPGGLSLYERSTNHVHYDARGVNERW